MSGQSLPQYKQLSEENQMRTVVVERGDNEVSSLSPCVEESKQQVTATFTPSTYQLEQQVSGYPVTTPVVGQFANEYYDNIYRPSLEAREPLPYGCGVMWFIFIYAWFIGGVFLWWIGVCYGVFLVRRDERERPGFIANLIAAIVGTIFFVMVFLMP